MAVRDRMRQDKQRQETRLTEAFQSPKWNATLVAEHSLRWLKTKSHVNEFLSIKEAAGAVLHRMILDGQFANSICRMLDTWKTWTDNAGMRKSDYEALKEEQVVFAQASLLVSVIRETGKTETQVSVALDLQECLMLWKKVRLG
ncbi:hypothetical protein jhhlp_003148 [Lomentospora prolificans]|uniref:Uncharacterized protein n=1 Tax=Lomentospora prolificans TaxID=41688 RepID=A0A2N3NG38_9PEZI|nr:hypothetical protein jhhlp_003148 [Lomentospora prolificans]